MTHGGDECVLVGAFLEYSIETQLNGFAATTCLIRRYIGKFVRKLGSETVYRPLSITRLVLKSGVFFFNTVCERKGNLSITRVVQTVGRKCTPRSAQTMPSVVTFSEPRANVLL